MPDHLLESTFRVFLDDKGDSFILYAPDLEAAQRLWRKLLGRTYTALTVVQDELGPGLQFLSDDLSRS